MRQQTTSSAYFDLGGTIRSRLASETIAFIKPLLNDFGIMRVANVTGLDCLDVPVAISIRPNSKHLSVSQGKGLSWELAMVSAVMESIEGYHAENPAEPTLQGAYQELVPNYPVVDPTQFNSGYCSIAQLQQWPLAWIEATDLINHKAIFIPHGLICLDSTKPHPEYAFLSVNSNGLASGNTLHEALCHALYEIIERDSLCRWATLSDSNRTATQLKLDTIDCPAAQQLLSKFYMAHQLVKVWDITSEIGVPTFHCVIRDANPLRGLGMFRGTGTHLSKEVALLRALTEVAQSRLTLISGSRDDVFLDHYQQRRSFSYSSADYEGKKCYSDCLQPPLTTNFATNVDYLLHQLTMLGLKQIFLVNHTKPAFNVPVVHVIVPGMQFNGTRI